MKTFAKLDQLFLRSLVSDRHTGDHSFARQNKAQREATNFVEMGRARCWLSSSGHNDPAVATW